jgi:hypothetical protein
MKKILTIVFCLVLMPLCLYAFDTRGRTVEIGVMHVNFGFANNLFSAGNFFQNTMVMDLDDLKKGFKLNIDLGLTPLYFLYNKDNLWGFGLAFGFDVMGHMDISGNMLGFEEAKEAKSSITAVSFASTQFSGFFNYRRFKITVKPSLFYPIFYVDPNISYTYINTEAGTILDLNYDIRVFTAFSLDSNSSGGLTASPGIDFHLGVEYPLSEVLNLDLKHRMLNFKVGLDLINIPMLPAQLKNYAIMSGRIGGEDPIDIFNDGFDNLYNSEDTVYGTGKKTVLRPFKMLAWADWSPFEKTPVSFIPTLGFAINPLYDDSVSLEAGLKARYNFNNLFITSLGIGYHDRLWKNSLDMALNLRFFEFNFGFCLRSQDFIGSWAGNGFGINMGLKFGW